MGIRFIHTADLHLDSPFLGLTNTMPKELAERVYESTFIAFERVIDAAIDRRVDFVLIVGDLYDGEDRSIKAQARLRRQMERLEKENIAAFILHGNHDHLGGSWIKLEMPKNVHIFDTNIEMKKYTTKTGKTVHLYGFSYPQRHVLEKKVMDYEKNGSADFHIALLHGQMEGGASHHQPYAPFTLQDLLQKDMDYWALGHIHQREILHEDPLVVYPGNIQGRHRLESGDKGCFDVTLSNEGNNSIRFVPTAPIIWDTLKIQFQEQMSFTDLFQLCREKIELMRQSSSVMLEVEVNYEDSISNEIKLRLENGEFLELLQDDLGWGENFIWPYRLITHHKRKNTLLFRDETFNRTLESVIESMKIDNSIDESIYSLFSNVHASRYLTTLNELDKEELLMRAKEIILERI